MLEFIRQIHFFFTVDSWGLVKDAIVDVFLLLYRVHLVLPALKDLLEHLVLL